MSYLKNYGPRSQATPQSEPIPGSGQVQNNAGGYAWEIDDWARMDRFLILGNEGGSYYAKERQMTRENAQCIERCIVRDGQRVVARIVEISAAGQAPKNDPALFALALAASLGSQETRRAALQTLPRVARIGTHLFHFLAFCESMRGWGRGLRNAVADWYDSKPVAELAYQAIKYQQRDGWSHRDLLRLAHPKAENEQRNSLYHWMVKGWDEIGPAPHPDEALRAIWAFERAKQATTARNLRADHRLQPAPRGYPNAVAERAQRLGGPASPHAYGGNDAQPGENDRRGLA